MGVEWGGGAGAFGVWGLCGVKPGHLMMIYSVCQ